MTSRKRKAQQRQQQHRIVANPVAGTAGAFQVVESVSKLAYTRRQAAVALGISLATLDRRVVPTIATVSTEWGARLIPVGELKRYLAERILPPRAATRSPRPAGRKPAVSPELAARMRAEHASGSSLGQIARRLNAEQVATAQGGRQWWPSTVRLVLARTPPLVPAHGATDPPAE